MQRLKRSWLAELLIAAIVAGFSPSLTHGAELLTNGGFEDEPNFGMGVSGDPGYSALTGNQIPGWTIVADHAATVHNTVLYPTISGGYSINTDGEGFMGHNADLYQDFASVGAASYAFSFDWQGWMNNAPNSQLAVSIIDLTTNGVLYSNLFSFSSTLHNESAMFLGTGNTLRLEINEMPESGVNDNQFIVDNFSVQGPIPEPSSLALIVVTGVAVTAWRARARRRIDL